MAKFVNYTLINNHAVISLSAQHFNARELEDVIDELLHAQWLLDMKGVYTGKPAPTTPTIKAALREQ